MVPPDEMRGLMPQPPDIEEPPSENLELDDAYGEEEKTDSPLMKYLDQGNIVEELEDNSKTATDIIGLYDEAFISMKPWRKKYDRALNLAKLQPTANGKEITKKTFPFDGASLAMMPYILEAALDFNSRSAPELAWANKIVHVKAYGKNTQEKEDRVKRVADFSNAQLDELIPQWKSEQDKCLFNLPIVGTSYKETYYDYEEQRVKSDLVLADKIVFNHNYSSFEESPDKFKECEFTRNQVIGFIRGEQKWDLSEDDLEEDKEDFKFIKAYTWIDLDDDGLKEPYVAIVYKEIDKIVCLYPCYDEDTIIMNKKNEIVKVTPIEYFTQYRFIPDPEGGPMGLGWGILLGPMFESINTTMRQLNDAGTLSLTAANSGLISKQMASGRGNAAKSGPIEIAMGKFTQIEMSGSGSLRDNIVQLPFAGPNPVMMQLLESLIASARSMTNAAVNVQAQAGEAAALYLAKLQQGLKIPNSIIMRVHDGAKKEFKKISLLNYKHFDDELYNNILDIDIQVSMEKDFNPKDFDLKPVADPSQGSDVERLQRAQIVFDMAKDPQQPQQVGNYRAAYIGLLEAMKTPNIDELAPEPDPNAKDPQAEMQQAMIMQQMADMELKKKDQDLRAEENKMKQLRITMEQQKQAMQAAKDMGDLGIRNDKTEAEIQRLYVQSLVDLVNLGLPIDSAISKTQQIESTFIDSKAGSKDTPIELEYDPFSGSINDRVPDMPPSEPISPSEPMMAEPNAVL
ncbi:MAG: hypothetical protein GXP14_07445 [Gammaproteobacteria bacterium]|nr:hypothetical protein [Gammaproteobacteria bacterium]